MAKHRFEDHDGEPPEDPELAGLFTGLPNGARKNGGPSSSPSLGVAKPRLWKKSRVLKFLEDELPPRDKAGKKGEPKVLAPREIELLEDMAGIGLTMPQISRLLRLPLRTLERRKKDTADVRAAYERGRARAAGKVAEALFRLSTGIAPDIRAIKWYEMSRLGRSEKMTLQGGDPDSPPAPPVEIRFIG